MSSTTIGLGNPLASASLEAPPLHIPNSKGEVYKTELVLERSAERVVKVNWWHGPDDDDIRATPHNHPWGFTSEVLHGALTEKRYTPDRTRPGEYVETLIRHVAGDSYFFPADCYHVVVDVAPGTVTRMTCGPVVNDPWGYLDLASGSFIPAAKDPGFFERLCTFNPFKRPKVQ